MKARVAAGIALGLVHVACSSSGQICSCPIGVDGVHATLSCGTSDCIAGTPVTCDDQENVTFGPAGACSTDGGAVCVLLGQSCKASADCCDHYGDVFPDVVCDSTLARCCMDATGSCKTAADCCSGHCVDGSQTCE